MNSSICEEQKRRWSTATIIIIISMALPCLLLPVLLIRSFTSKSPPAHKMLMIHRSVSLCLPRFFLLSSFPMRMFSLTSSSRRTCPQEFYLSISSHLYQIRFGITPFSEYLTFCYLLCPLDCKYSSVPSHIPAVSVPFSPLSSSSRHSQS